MSPRVDIETCLMQLRKTIDLYTTLQLKTYEFTPTKSCDFFHHMMEGLIKCSNEELDAVKFCQGTFDIMAMIPGIHGDLPSSVKIKAWEKEVNRCLQEMQALLGSRKTEDAQRYIVQNKYRLAVFDMCAMKLRLFLVQRGAVWRALGVMTKGTQWATVFERHEALALQEHQKGGKLSFEEPCGSWVLHLMMTPS